MSIPVDPADLEQVLADFDSGYLLTTSSPQVKVVTVDPVVEGGVIRISGPGGGTLRNVSSNPAVTLVHPPRERHGYTLLVDGAARAEGDDLVVEPATAVLHRPAAHADGPLPPEGCGHDCRPVAP